MITNGQALVGPSTTHGRSRVRAHPGRATSGVLAFAGALIAAGCAGAAVNRAAPFGHGSWLAAYLVFVAIRRPELHPTLRDYWPARGPRWDALAVAFSFAGEALGPVMVEAKSHVPEMYDRKGCRAEGSRREDIAAALAATRKWLGAPASAEAMWMGALYQSAHRLAHLRLFRQQLGECAWLVNLYFVHDRHAYTTRRECNEALSTAEHRLGLAGRDVPGLARVFLEAGERDELLTESILAPG